MPDKKPKIRGNDPKFSQRKNRPDCRRIDLPSGEWFWKTDGRRVVVLYDPDDERTEIPVWNILGIPKERFERLMLDDDYAPAITPGVIVAYIGEMELA